MKVYCDTIITILLYSLSLVLSSHNCLENVTIASYTGRNHEFPGFGNPRLGNPLKCAIYFPFSCLWYRNFLHQRISTFPRHFLLQYRPEFQAHFLYNRIGGINESTVCVRNTREEAFHPHYLYVMSRTFSCTQDRQSMSFVIIITLRTTG